MNISERKFKRKKTTVYETSIYIPGESSSYIRAILVDISEDGIGLSTEYPLKPGQLIEILTPKGVVTGTVMWTLKQDSLYRAGIYRVDIKNLFD